MLGYLTNFQVGGRVVCCFLNLLGHGTLFVAQRLAGSVSCGALPSPIIWDLHTDAPSARQPGQKTEGSLPVVDSSSSPPPFTSSHRQNLTLQGGFLPDTDFPELLGWQFPLLMG